MGGVFEGGAKGIETVARRREVERAHQAAGAATEAVQAAQDSKLAARDPERFRDLVRQIAGEGSDVRLPAAELQVLYQSGVIDDALIRAWGIDGHLAETLAAGGDVSIPADRFLASPLGGERLSQVIRHLRIGPSDMTVAEAEAYMSDPQRQKDITDLVESMFAANDTARPGQIIEDDVTRALMASGLYREADARASAVLIRERMIQRARDRGMDPDALWLEEKPAILGPVPKLAVDDLDLVLERLRSGNEVKPPRQPVLDIFRSQGGIAPASPLAAELNAMGIAPKTAPGLFRAGGMTSADTVVVSEHEVLRDNALAADPNGYADPNALLQAIGREWAGNPLTTTADAERIARLDEPVRQLRDLLERHGIDPATATKAQVLEAMDRADAVSPGQPSAQALEQSWLKDVGEKIRSVIAVARRDKTSKAKERLFQVPQWFANLARDKAGLEVSGYDVSIDAFSVRHTVNSHGDAKAEEARGNVAVTDADIEAFPVVVSDPDRIVLGAKNKRGQDQVFFIRAMEDGSTLVATEVRTGGRDITLSSLRRYPERTNADTIVAALIHNVRNALSGTDPIVVTREEIVNARGGDTALLQPDGGIGALDQAINTGVDPERMVHIVDLSAMTGAKRKPSDLITRLKEMIGRPLTTADAERVAQVLPENVKHITYSGAPAAPSVIPIRNKLVTNLPTLLEHAALIESGPNTKSDKKPSVIDYHRFYVPVADRGQIKVVRIVAHRTKAGLRIDPGSFDVYDVVLEDKRVAPNTSGSPHGSPSSALLGGHPSSISIRQMLTGVKDMKGVPYFQPDGDMAVRGSFNPLSDTIRLFEGADLSTFLHESGHHWLFQMIRDLRDRRLTSEARERITRDLKTVFGWLKVDLDVTTAHPSDLQAAIAVRQHEQWARGVEAYLMEGKAPSAALESVFARFSAWLIRIYAKVRNLGVRLTPEVRGVMDRLLASEEAIAAQRADSVYRVPSDLTEAFTPAERSRIEAAQERAALEARQELQGRVMKELARERFQWWKEERAKVRAEVDGEVRRQPARAVVALARGERPDGTKLAGEDGAPRHLRLDRRALVAEYGEEIIKLMPRGITVDKGGISHHVMASMVGLNSGDALRLALMEAKADPLKEAVERETDRRMRERHGDMVTDGRIAHDAADIVATGRRQLEAVALQARALRRLAGETIDRAAARRQAETGAGTKVDDRARLDAAAHATDQAINAGIPAEGVTTPQVGEAMAAAEGKAAGIQRKAQSAAVRQTRNLLAGMDHAAIREAAARFIAARPVRQATDAAGYRAQARRHARAAELAIAARDYAAAADAKERQLLNMEMEAQARSARREVEKVERKAHKLDASDEKLSRTTDQDFFKAARRVYARFGLARPDAAFDADTWRQRLEAEDPAGAADVLTMIAALESLPVNGRVAVRIGPDGRRSEIAPDYRDMKLSDLRELRDGVDALLAMGRNARSAEIEGERVEFSAMVAEMSGQVGGRGNPPALDHTPTDGERRAIGLLGLLAAGRRVESWARDMDGGDTGPFTRYLLRPILASVYAYQDARRATMTQLRDVLAPMKDELSRPLPIAAPELGFTFNTKAELLHAMAHAGNDSNLRKLLLGYRWGEERRDGTLDRSRWDAFMARLHGEGTITKAHWDLVQGIWDVLEETKAPAQAAHRKMFGFNFKEIEARPVQTPFGEYRGGYVPAITDKAPMDDGGRFVDAEALMSQQNAAMFPAAERGFTKGRVDYNQPLALNLGMIPAHASRVLMFAHIGPAVRQAARLIRRGDFGRLMAQVDRTAVNDLLTPWLQRTARQTLETPATGEGGRMGDRIFRYLRVSSGMQAMVGNIVNAAQQITGIASAAVLVPPAALGRALITAWRDPAMSRQAIMERSAFMRHRMDTAGREVSADIESFLKSRTVLGLVQDVAQRHGYFAQTFMQDMVDRVVWAAAYDHWTGKGVTETEAVDRADSAVRTSQGSFDPQDVSRVETGPAWARLFTMFYSYFNAQANMLGTEVAVTLRTMGWRGGSGRLAALYLFGGFLPAVLAEAITQAAKGELGDEDDDGWADDLAELFLLSQLRYFAAFVPGIGQSVNLIANQFNDKPHDDRMSTSPAVGMLEGAARAAKTVPMAVFSDGDKSRATADGINLIGTLLGIPLGWLRKPASYAVDVAEGDSRPQHIGHTLSGVLTGQDGTARH